MGLVLACDPDDGSGEPVTAPELLELELEDVMAMAPGDPGDPSTPGPFGSGPAQKAAAEGEVPPRCEGGADCCGDLPVKVLDHPVSWNFASDVCLVAGDGVSAVVDLGHRNVVVPGAGGQVVLAPHAGIVFGNGGDDVLKVHGGTVVPGPGADFVRVGPGGHAVVNDPCELAPGTVLVGGPGSRLTTPIDVPDLHARCVWPVGFETVEVRAHPCRAECREDDVCFAREVGVAFDPQGVATALPGQARPVDPRPAPRLSDEPPEVGPNLAARLETADPGEVVEGIVVTVESEVPLPVLPRFVAALPRETAVNQAILAERRALLEGLRQERLAEQAALVAAVEAAGGTVREHAPVAGALVVDLPAGAVPAVLAEPLVRRMELSDLSAPPPPPVPGGDAFSMAEARALTGADGLRAYGYDGDGYHIGLVENGVRDHPLLEGRIGLRKDCQVVQNGACVGTEPEDCIDNSVSNRGHGTSSAAIMVGNADFGSEDEGVAVSTVDSWRVNESKTVFGESRCLLAGAVALEAAVIEAAALTDIVVANVQVPPSSPEYAATLSLGDRVFPLGIPLLAAAGNYGSDPGVAAPGRTQNAIAVGATLPDLTVASYSGRGPGEFGLVKPNVLGPTNLITACAPEASACVGPDFGTIFGGTSAATPFVGGLATLLLHAYDMAGGATEPPELMPGRLYATLTAFAAPPGGDGTEPPDDDQGAGLVQVGPVPCLRWRWTTLQLPDEGGSASVELHMPQGAEDVRVGAWWSNKENGQTVLPPWDVAVRLRKGAEVYEAATPGTNFQRLWVDSLGGGVWTLEVETVGDAPFTGRRVHVFVYHRLPDFACYQ